MPTNLKDLEDRLWSADAKRERGRLVKAVLALSSIEGLTGVES